VIYENGAAKLWQTEAGYISMNDSKYHYYLQDHQGNNRVVVNETGATEEVNHYYAFGGLFSSDESIQPFKYNGKELDTQKGLNWYDYGARQYDATLGRWFAVDPLGEDYYPESSYAYCGNNSINRIDPTGKDYWSTSNPDEIKKFWNWLLQNSNKSLDTYSFSTDLWFKMEDKEFIDAYKKYGQQALTYNDQTN
jgi:RHS repeat-associated protein